jgi:hypothetical protein
LQNLAAIARAEQLTVEIVNADARLVEPAKAVAATREVERLRDRRGPYTVIARRAAPDFIRAASTLALVQTRAHQALIACGLERHRVAHGQFPETLDKLVPDYLAKLPHDVINGQSLKYRRTQDGSFILYSVGWNETDDGGTVVLTSGNSPAPDPTQGDWLWQSSAQQ